MYFVGLSIIGPVWHINIGAAPGVIGAGAGAAGAPPNPAYAIAAAAVAVNAANQALIAQ